MRNQLDKNIAGGSNWLESERKRERRTHLFGERDSARYVQTEHERICDAEVIRNEHQENCDANELKILHSYQCANPLNLSSEAIDDRDKMGDDNDPSLNVFDDGRSAKLSVIIVGVSIMFIFILYFICSIF